MPSGAVHSSCTDPTQATAHLVIVLVSRIQKSGTGDNNFVKWNMDRSKWTTFKAGPEYSSRTKLKWSVPFDVTTEIFRVMGWMECAHDEPDPSQCQQEVNSLLFSLWSYNAASNSGAIFGKAKSALLLYCIACDFFIPWGKLWGVEVVSFDLPKLLDGYVRRQIHTPKQKGLQYWWGKLV